MALHEADATDVAGLVCRNCIKLVEDVPSRIVYRMPTKTIMRHVCIVRMFMEDLTAIGRMGT